MLEWTLPCSLHNQGHEYIHNYEDWHGSVNYEASLDPTCKLTWDISHRRIRLHAIHFVIFNISEALSIIWVVEVNVSEIKPEIAPYTYIDAKANCCGFPLKLSLLLRLKALFYPLNPLLKCQCLIPHFFFIIA